MRRVLINLQNFMFADAIERTLLEDGDLRVINVTEPEEVIQQCRLTIPEVLFLEVTGYTPWKFAERRKIWKRVKEFLPQCKVVLMVDENAEHALASQVMDAKQSGKIDAFVFSSVSSSYLAALLQTV